MVKRYIKVIGMSSAALIMMMLIFFSIINTLYPNLRIENGGGDKITKLGKITGSSYTLENLNVDGTGSHGLEFENDVILTLVGENKIVADKDGINAKGKLTIQGTGTLTIECADDAIRADKELIINNGNIVINKCTEGLESEHITVNGGKIDITSANDGINATVSDIIVDTNADVVADTDVNSVQSANAADCSITINDGTIKITAKGDGIDSNGSLTVNGGTIYSFINSTDNTAADADGKVEYNGGIIVVGGTAGFEKFDGKNSYVFTKGDFKIGDQIAVQNDNGTIIDFEVYMDSAFIALSSPNIVYCEEYTIFCNKLQVSVVTAGMGGLGMRGIGNIQPEEHVINKNIPSAVTDESGVPKFPKKENILPSGGGPIPPIGHISSVTTKLPVTSSSRSPVVTTSNVTSVTTEVVVESVEPYITEETKKFITEPVSTESIDGGGNAFWTTSPAPAANDVPDNVIVEAGNKGDNSNNDGEVKIQLIAPETTAEYTTTPTTVAHEFTDYATQTTN